MKALMKLKEITRKQKTIRTNRLLDIVQEIDKERIKLSDKIKAQQKSIEELNKQYQRAKTEADKRSRAMNDYENLKRNQQILRRHYSELEEAHKKTKKQRDLARAAPYYRCPECGHHTDKTPLTKQIEELEKEKIINE